MGDCRFRGFFKRIRYTASVSVRTELLVMIDGGKVIVLESELTRRIDVVYFLKKVRKIGNEKRIYG